MDLHRRFLVPSILLLGALGLAAAPGPVYLHETNSTLVLGNDYLERSISIAGDHVGTTQFLNKLSGRTYAVSGPEFELRLIYERVGYGFGSENPMVVTADGLRVFDHKVDDLPGGGKRVTLQLGPSRGRGRGLDVDLVYELNPGDFFTRQWLHVSKPRQGTDFIDWVSVAKNRWVCRNSRLAVSANRCSPTTCS